jgi:predicted porin
MFNLGENAMKKSLVALAALAVAGAASAQSSVTLFGVVDAAISGYSNKAEDTNTATLLNPFYLNRGAVTTSQTALTNSGYNSSRLGFRGTEDLGGGLAASFWLEASVNNNNGTGYGGGGLQFNRRSTVSLSGNFGEIRLGRDYTPTFWNDTVFDPFGANGVGTNLISTASGKSSPGSFQNGFIKNGNYVRANNSVGYFLPPNLGGFYGQFMYAFNGNTSYSPGGATPPGIVAVAADQTLAKADNARAGRYIGGRLGYANGPLDVALAYGESTIASNYYLGSTTTLDTWNLGASYDFDVVKLFGEYSNNKQNTNLAVNAFNPFGVTKPGANGGLIGVTVPVGAGLIRASYGEVRYNNLTLAAVGTVPNPKADQFAIGYVYNLSKRTALYATFAYLKNDNGSNLGVVNSPAYFTGALPGSKITALPQKSMGYDLGIRHAF